MRLDEATTSPTEAGELLKRHILAQQQLNQQFLTISKNLDARLTTVYTVLLENKLCDSEAFETSVDHTLGWTRIEDTDVFAQGDLIWAEYEYNGTKSVIFEIGDKAIDFSTAPVGHSSGFEFPCKGKADDNTEFDVVMKVIKGKRRIEK